MKHRFALLLAIALVAATTGLVSFSSAVFDAQSDSSVTASTDRIQNWLSLYSQSTDPDGLGGYAIRRLSSPPVPAATGMNEGLTADLGGFPDRNQQIDLPRVFTIKTPSTFPDPGVTQITVTVSRVADPATGEQPLRNPTLAPIGNNGGAATVTLAAGQKRQCNITVQARKRFQIGQTYYPHVLVTVTFGTVPAGYYVYDIPMAVTDAGA